jgi:predicted MFS family arabinose efflux permease
MAQATIFALLAYSGQIRLWQVIVLYFIFGSLLAIDHPARRAFLVDLVSRDELANAVALNATIFNFSSLIGFAAAGLLIAAMGVSGTMMVNAATYLAPILALAAIRVRDVRQDVKLQPVKAAFVEGVITLWKQPKILATVSLMAVIGGLAWPVFGMMPAFAEDVLQTNSIGLGLLLAAGAFGSLIGTVLVARVGMSRRGRTLTVVSFILPLLIIGFALSDNMLQACLFLIALGVGLIVLVMC